MLVHGTCVAFRVGGKNLAVLIRGKSGSGKSDLALRVLSLGGWLISDDQVVLKKKSRVLLASAPKTIKGLLEVRGVGICKIKEVLPSAILMLVVDLVPQKLVPRLPQEEFETIGGIRVVRRNLYAFEASAALKLYKILVE